MNKLALKIIAGIAFLVQVMLPVWWGAVFASFSYFWVEGIVEGGILGKEVVTGVDQAGNSIIGQCLLTDPCSFTTLLWGLFSIYSLVAIIVAAWSFFSTKTTNLEYAYRKKDSIFLIVNLITIILSIIIVSINGGVFPRM